jgi:hypothetical protein
MPPARHTPYLAVGQNKGGKAMSKAFGVHTYELEPGVTEEDFEKFVIEEVHSLPTDFGEFYILKGDKGERKGKYAGLLVMENPEVRDKFFGSPSGEPASVEMSDEWKEVFQKWMTLTTYTFTDYVVIGK